MSRKVSFLLTFSFFSLVWAFFAYTVEQSEGRIEMIDQRIAELQKMKRGYEGRALRHEDLAERLQFETHALLETRRHNQLADENWAKAARVQEEIDRLEREKKRLEAKQGKGHGKTVSL